MKTAVVVHVVVAGDIGGAERFLVDLVRHSDPTRVRHAVALMTPNPELREYLATAGLSLADRGPVRENPVAFLWRSLGPADLGWLVNVIGERAATVVHCHTLGSHVIAVRAARRAGVPVIRTEHAVGHYLDPTASPFTRWAARRTDRIVCISEFVRSAVVRAEPLISQRTMLIHNGVDADYFAPREGVVSRHLRFVVVARLEKVKNVDLAIAAMAHARTAHLDVVGDGAERPRLERLTRTLGLESRVSFVGFQRDPRPFVASADALLSPSPTEGFGLSVIEAMAMARPVVAVAGSAVDAIVEDGVTGVLVASSSPEVFGATLDGLDQGALFKMGAAAREAVLSRFSCETTVEKYTNLYEEIAARTNL
jgi:glycosyltransferase involved in cell wall biosynthesis